MHRYFIRFSSTIKLRGSVIIKKQPMKRFFFAGMMVWLCLHGAMLSVLYTSPVLASRSCDIQSPLFCNCMKCSIYEGCRKRKFPEQFCNNVETMKLQVRMLGEEKICRKYMPLGLRRCTTALRIFYDTCSLNFNSASCN